jgi:HK97 family phage prohead protease
VHFDVPVRGFTVDTRRRIIEGVALPYGQDQVATKYGLKYRFVRGALQWGSVNRVKLLRDHDMGQAIGVATDLTDLAAGLSTRFKVARGAEGDAALSLAHDGVLDGLSVGVDFDFAEDVFMDDQGVMNVTRADLREVSLTAMPAFDDARVTKVAASRARGNTMPCSICGQIHAEGVACQSAPTPPAQQNGQPANQQPAAPGLQLSDDQLRALVANPAALAALTGVPAQQQGQQAQQAQQFTLTSNQINALAAGGHLRTLLGIGAPAEPQGEPEPPRQVVDPTRRLTASVNEALPYRFDRKGNLTRGAQYDFSTDMIAGLRDGHSEALARAELFMRETFAAKEFALPTDTTDAAALNPDRQRPDLYVDQKEFAYPIWNAIAKGTIPDATPFVLPKFSSSSGLVGAHTQGTEPTAGDFTATTQTITPTAVSGKCSITREAWDQGGNPQLSGLIWNQMVRGWFEALEAAAVTLLDGLSPTGITLTTGAADDALVGELEAALAALQYARGGFRMRDFFVQVDLYKALIAAVDGDGRKLLPWLNPVNANGQVSDFFGDVMVGGLRGRPAWALAATGDVAASSYLFDRADVSGWATAPQRLSATMGMGTDATGGYAPIAMVDIGIWGYKALANTDLTGVREVIYDPTV